MYACYYTNANIITDAHCIQTHTVYILLAIYKCNRNKCTLLYKRTKVKNPTYSILWYCIFILLRYANSIPDPV